MQDLKNLFVNQFNSQFQPNQLVVSRSGFSLSSLTGTTEKAEDKKKEKAILTDKVINEIKNDSRVEKLDAILLISGLQMRLKGEENAYEQPFMSGWDTDRNNTYFSKVTSEKDKPGKNEVFVSQSFIDFYNLTPDQAIGKEMYVETSLTSFFSTKSRSNFNKQFKYKIAGVFDPAQDRNDAWFNTSEGLKILVSVGGFKDSKEYLKEIGYDQLMISIKLDKIDEYKTYFEEKYGHTVTSSEEILGFLGNITDGLTVALVGFGLVSAIVASIGIINTMIMSIYEQTKEIGIIKAIGASNTQVLIIFLIQSGVIGMIGGAMGLGIVLGGMKVLDPIVVTELGKAGFETTKFFTFDPKIAMYIVLASILVGIIAGLYPALRASRLDPVKALRYE
jgi:putative ABC transport system permease protein